MKYWSFCAGVSFWWSACQPSKVKMVSTKAGVKRLLGRGFASSSAQGIGIVTDVEAPLDAFIIVILDQLGFFFSD